MSTTSQGTTASVAWVLDAGRSTTRALRVHIALLVASVGTFAFHVWASSGVLGPTVAFDEPGYLGNARWLAGAGAGWEMPTSPRYAVGYPLVLAPLTRLFPDPEVQWRAVLTVNAALLAAVLPLLYLVCRRLLNARPWTALAAACVGALAPAAVAAGPSAISENLVFPLVPATVLAGWAVARPGPWPRRVLFGPAAALLYAAHPRFVPMLAVTAALLVALERRRLAPRAVIVANAAALAVGSAAAWLATRAVEAARWDHVERLEGDVDDVRALLSSADGWAEVARVAVGQAWYLAAGSLGLAAVGLVAVVARVRSRPIDGAGPVAEADRWILAWYLTVAGGVFGVSVLFFSFNQFRADHLVYGRHNDSLVPLLLAASVVALARGPRHVVARLLGVGATATAGLGVVLVLTRDPELYGGRYAPFAVPAIIRFAGRDAASAFWLPTVVALGAVGVFAMVVLVVRRPILITPLFACWGIWMGTETTSATAAFSEYAYRGWAAPDDVTRLGIDSVSIDVTAAETAWPAMTWPFFLPDVAFHTFDPRVGDRPVDAAVLTRLDEPVGVAPMSRVAMIDQRRLFPRPGAPKGLALWIAPGPLFDRLDATGALLPAGYPDSPLPREARTAELEILGLSDDGVVSLAPGDDIELGLRGRHAGTGSPWPAPPVDSSDTRVRVRARIDPVDSDLPPSVMDVAELPSWMIPGDVFVQDLVLFAIGERYEPLPPGSYVVTLALGQGSDAWWDTAAADTTIRLEVG